MRRRASALLGVALAGALAGSCRDKGSRLRPSTTQVWAGVVAVSPLDFSDLASATVDDDALELARSPANTVYVDTTRLADGEHDLTLRGAKDGDEITESITVANGPGVEAGTRFEPWPIFPIDPSGSQLTAERTAAGAISADFDGDGRPELFVWSRGRGQAVRIVGDAAVPFGPIVDGVTTAAAGDLDGDGWVDLLAGGVGLHALRNTGGRGLVEVQPELVADPPGVSIQLHGITLFDLDDDGRLDLGLALMSCDQPRSSRVLRNEGGWRFTDVAKSLGLDTPRSATFAYVIDEPEPGAGKVAWPMIEGCRPDPERAYVRFLPGDDLPATEGPREFRTEALRGGMGSAWFDADRDGHLDLFVSNASTQPVLRGPDYFESISTTVGLYSMPDPMLNEHNQWGAALYDADLDGADDLLVTQSHLPPLLGDGSLQPRLWLMQRGRGLVFHDTAEAAGLGGARRCMGLHVVDLDGDGDAEVLAGCARGVELWRNLSTRHADGRLIQLHGTISNPAGVGARIAIEGNDTRLVRGGGQPFMPGESAPTLRAPEGSRIQVTWPSGLVQEVVSGAAPFIVVEEPRLWTLSASEVAPGGTVEFTVAPARVGRASDPVECELSGGTWLQAPTRGPDGDTHATILAPSTAGSMRLTVRIGGKAMKVRPRIIVR